MGIKHQTISGLPSDRPTGRVGGGNYQDDHLHIPFLGFDLRGSAALTPTAASAAVGVECFLTSRGTRHKVDLALATMVRMTMLVTTNSTTTTTALKLQYATADAATWGSGTGVADAGPSIVVGSGTLGIIRDTGWMSLAAGARIDNCYLAVVVGTTAMGTTAAQVGQISVYYK